MSKTTQTPEEADIKAFFDLVTDIRPSYVVSMHEANKKAIQQLRDDIETAVAVLPENWSLDIYVKVFELLHYVSEKTGRLYTITINKFLDVTTSGKVGDMQIILLTSDPVLCFSKQGILTPYLAVLSPGTIVTMDIKTKKSTRHDNNFAFVQYCLDVMCKDYK